MRHRSQQALITDTNPKSPAAEAYRTLRTNIQFMCGDGEPLQVMTMASAVTGEGKTTTIVNLAIAFAQEGKKVVLIDGDMRRPRIHEIFGTYNEVGLSSILRGSFHPVEVARETYVRHLHVIPSGPIPNNPSELLSSADWDSFIEPLKAEFDIILIDAPPVLAVADGNIIAAKCDGVVLVICSGKLNRGLVKKAQAKLKQIKANVIGVVLNNQKKTKERSYNDNYYVSNR